MKDRIEKLSDGKRIQYIGWVNTSESYQLFASADLVVFPGRHSVYWEQVAAQGIPMICKYWEGTTHIDVGGNVIFLTEDSIEKIQELLEQLQNKEADPYKTMYEVAKNKGKDIRKAKTKTIAAPKTLNPLSISK